MDYYKRIQNAIEFIESNLQEELRIHDIAAQACFSPFHFQRLFQAISGFSVNEYIRKRRLSEAANLLKQSGASVLEIAVSFQYSSQEAFSRAFESCFGITPVKYRKGELSITGQGKVDFLDYRKSGKGAVDMRKPTILQLDSTKIIGYEYKTNLANAQHYREIPGFYEDFGRNQYYLRIPNRAMPDFAYGISCRFQDDGNFSFIIGEEVSELGKQLDVGFENFEIPAGRYAEFKVDTAVNSVENVREYIYGTWLPNSNYERTDGPDYEVTDVMNSIGSAGLKIKIYIPIT